MNRALLATIAATLSIGSALGQAGVESELRKLGDFFQIYMVREDRRGPEDAVDVRRNRDGTYVAEISYWRSLSSRDPGEEICQAYGWLLFGRGSYGKGAKDAFEKYPTLSQINLRLYDMEFGTRVGRRRAEILPTQKMIPYLRIGVGRANLAKKMSEGSVKRAIEKGKCAGVGKDYFNLVWLDEGYIRQAK